MLALQNLRSRIRGGEALVGAFVTAPCAELVEVAAHGGFDFAVIDAEHGPITIADVLHMTRAGQALSLPIIVRVPEATKDFVLRALDAGVDGVIIPQIETADGAKLAFSSAHYPPHGNRGAAYYARTHGFTKFSGFSAINAAEQRVVVGLQIETPTGVENADAILAATDADFILIGPTDLAVTIGNAPNTEAIVNNAVTAVGKACASRNVAAAIGTPNPALAADYRSRGYSMIVTGLLPLLLRAGSDFAERSRAALNAGVKA